MSSYTFVNRLSKKNCHKYHAVYSIESDINTNVWDSFMNMFLFIKKNLYYNGTHILIVSINKYGIDFRYKSYK